MQLKGGLLGLLLVAQNLIPATTILGGSQEYRLALPDNQMVVYRVELDVEHPGPLVIKADWEGARVLSFHLERLDASVAPIRRSGPSPLRIEVDVAAGEAGRERPWLLSVRGLPARGAATARLTVDFPESPALVRQEQQAAMVRDLPAPPDPWREPLVPSVLLSPEWARVYRETERFRRVVVEEATRDNFGWHDDLLRSLAEHREQTGGAGGALPPATRSMLERIVAAVRGVEDLSRSDDPILAGPAPTDRRHRETWIMLQDSRMLPLERQLDAILYDLQQGHAPELARDVWCTRFVSTLMACQRHFKERTRPGAPRTTGPEQWGPVLAAAAVLESLTELP